MPSPLLRNSFNNSSSQKIIPFTIAQAVINRFGTIALGTVLVLGGVLTIGSSASAMGIDGWKYDPEKGQVEFEIEDGVKPRHFLMAQPARIVVDLQNTQIGNAPPEMKYTSGPIQRITVEQLQPLLTRVTLYTFPNAVFAKGQVAIDRLGDGNRGLSDVWALRPLINLPGSGSGRNSPIVPPSQIQRIAPAQPLVLPTVSPTVLPIATVSQSIPIAVPLAKPEVPSIPPILNVPPPPTTLFAPIAPMTEGRSESIPPFSPDPKIVAKAGEGIVLPDSLPIVVPTVLQPTTVSVPPLSTISPAVPPKNQPPIAPNLPPNVAPNVMRNPNPKVIPTALPLPDRVPQSIPLQIQPQPIVPKSVVQPISPPSLFPAAAITQPIRLNPIGSSPSSAPPDVISFGQPLRLVTPPQSSKAMPFFGTAPAMGIVMMKANDGRMGLPLGTVLTARYTGVSSLSVKDGARKEMLALQSAIRDRNGVVIASEGTTIYGAFEGGSNRFLAESIVIQGQVVALNAESANLGGARSPSERSLLQNSGIGVLAGVLIGGLSGGSAIGGAAAGAIASYVTAPKVATIQPGQALELKLTQDWIIPFGLMVSQGGGD